MEEHQAVGAHDTSISNIFLLPTEWHLGRSPYSIAQLLICSQIFTKPLQGSVFHKLWDQIMNIDPATYQPPDDRSELENADQNPECSDLHVTWADVLRYTVKDNELAFSLFFISFTGYESIRTYTVVFWLSPLPCMGTGASLHLLDST